MCDKNEGWREIVLEYGWVIEGQEILVLGKAKKKTQICKGKIELEKKILDSEVITPGDLANSFKFATQPNESVRNFILRW